MRIRSPQFVLNAPVTLIEAFDARVEGRTPDGFIEEGWYRPVLDEWMYVMRSLDGDKYSGLREHTLKHREISVSDDLLHDVVHLRYDANGILCLA